MDDDQLQKLLAANSSSEDDSSDEKPAPSFDADSLKAALSSSTPSLKSAPAGSMPADDDKDALLDKLNKFTGKTPVDSRMNTSDAISKLLGSNQADLDDAIKQRNQLQLLGMIEHVGNTAGNALTPLARPNSDADYQAHLATMAQAPIQDVMAKQALAREGLQNQASAQQLGQLMANSDENSSISSTARDILKQAAKSAQMNINIPDNLTAAQAEKLMPGIENMANRRVQMQNALMMKQMMMGNQQATKQNQMLGQTQQLLESARGNPAAQQAERDLYSADKAKSLINLYGDPDKLSPQMVNTLVAEVAKISGGGAPTLEGMKALTPDTLSSQLAGVKQKLLNEPTPANAGAFVKQYGDYIDKLKDDAKKVISDKYGRIIESRKGQLSPENYGALQDQYLNRFAEKEAAAAHPQDSEAMAWAKANPSDPRAAAIMKANGM